jgi:hypothetical protein
MGLVLFHRVKPYSRDEVLPRNASENYVGKPVTREHGLVANALVGRPAQWTPYNCRRTYWTLKKPDSAWVVSVLKTIKLVLAGKV